MIDGYSEDTPLSRRTYDPVPSSADPYDRSAHKIDVLLEALIHSIEMLIPSLLEIFKHFLNEIHRNTTAGTPTSDDPSEPGLLGLGLSAESRH